MALRTPLYDWHVARGGRIVEFGGWDMPIQYSSIIEEHQAVRNGCGLFDVSHMGRLIFEGPEALDLLQRVWTNNAADMKSGQVRYGLICNDRGGILDDVLVYRFEQFWLMVVNASNREKILAWLEKPRAQFRADVTDLTTRWAMVAIQGPQALTLLQASGCFVGVSPLLEGRADAEAGRLQALELEKLRYYFAAICPTPLAQPGEVAAIVSRTGYTGEDGFEVILPSPEVVGFCDLLLEVAAKRGIPLRPCGLGARDTLRLEAAMPLYGHELNEDIDPFQAGLAWAVKLDKGDFLGREALLRRKEDPALRRRVGLEVEGKRIAREGAAVNKDGREIGRVTSGTFSPTLQKPIAMAYLEPAFAAVGTTCSLDLRGKEAAARVVPLPFYKRGK